MRVTFCLHDRPGYVGGPNAGLRRLLPDLRNRGVDVHVLSLMFGDPMQCPTLGYLRKLGIPCTIARYHKTTEERVRWLLGMLRRDPTDVFVANLMVAAYFATPWVRAAGIPCVGVIRSSDQFHLEFLATFGNGDPRFRQDAFVCVSDHMRRKTLELAPQVHHVRQICSSPPAPSGMAQAPGDGPLRMAYLGQIVEYPKNISAVIRAFCRAAREVPGVEGVLYGHGKDWESARRTLEENGRGVPVTMAGPMDNEQLIALLPQHHTITLFSEYEGLPLSLLEGMSAGLVPVCTPTQSGIPELVLPGETGILVKDREQAFVDAIRSLREHPETWAKLSQGARARIAAQYSREVCADRWAELFQELHGSLGARKRVPIPLRLHLPPAGCICREDDRASKARALRAALFTVSGRWRPMDNGTAGFLAPRCVPGNIDRCIIRRSILCAIKANLPELKGRVLDIGAGYAPYRTLFQNRPEVESYRTADMAGGLYEQSSPPDVVWDGKTLPLDPESVDSVLLTEVLEHCQEPERLLAECHRVLAPQGRLFLTVPFLWPLHDVPHDAYRYSPWTLERLLGRAGFEPPLIRALGGYEAAMGQMLGLFIRRRSRRPLYNRWIRPVLSVLALPWIALLARLDRPPEDFKEGQMVTGLWALARKSGGMS